MASVPMVLHRIRRTRRKTREGEATGQFKSYRPAYQEILVAAREIGGEAVLDDVLEWAIEWTERERRLPEPERMRTAVLDILDAEGLEVPADSPLLETTS